MYIVYTMILYYLCVCTDQEHTLNCAQLNGSCTSFVFWKSPAHIGVFLISLRERWLTLIRKWQIVTKDNAVRSSGDYKGR